ncbi:MAG: pyruvate dehydrogenase, partial [Rhodobacteraceae bacterium]|nr:pyruvate dehydrogenase [Paracoccaceae bacterium]
MPHEVIMPALGMAQDTGLLVAWLKAPGDAVAVGEALFEVETDKATMEVEAPADGYLAEVSAQAGEAVPVGSVIARIADSPEDAAAPAAAAQAAAEPAAPAAAAPAQPAGHEVIMPALGMAQDAGLLVAWLKAAGDAVAEDDALFEVETDKSTAEVPAGR